MQYRVEIVQYHQEWPVLFHAWGARIRQALSSVALRIDHIGSTAVPGLAAKPIIDIQISVVTLEPVAAYRAQLESLGLVFRPDNDERTKRYFREAPGTRRTHIHVRRAGSFGEQLALLFRDYLRLHGEDAARYAALKQRLAIVYADDRHAYTDAKGPFIWEVIRRASDWSQATGWEPGPSDA